LGRGMPRPRDARLADLAWTSVEVIRANQSRYGSYVACPRFDPYRYSWLRDGAFIADSMSRAGEIASAEAFFAWCARVLEERKGTVERLVRQRARGEPVDPAEHLHARYKLDGRDAPAEWSNFQLDGYGTWLWALAGHVVRHGADPAPFLAGADLSARYIAAYWDEPCFDWWEERQGVHVATLAAIAAGLRGAAAFGGGDAKPEIERTIRERGTVDGRLRASLDDDRLDGSLLAVGTPFGVLPPDAPIVEATVAALERGLAHGGVHRYPEDAYYGGGEWLLLTALLGLHYAEAGREDDARRQLGWIAASAEPDGSLPEQVSDHLLRPDAYEEWVGRWGPPASPLLWSHAFYLHLALRLGVVEAGAGR
jgi:GH15 family glucan-1,4-alpha-glucosidase